MAGGVTTVLAYLLARLALDRSLHGQGLGSQLLVDALDVIAAAAETAAGRLIVVDAIDDAACDFYRHHDFHPIKGDQPAHPQSRHGTEGARRVTHAGLRVTDV